MKWMLLVLLLPGVAHLWPSRGYAGPIPSGQPRDDDLTTIAALICTDGQIMKRASGTWACSADAGAGGGSEPSDGNKNDITVTGTGTIWTINTNAITNAKLADVATGTIKGRVTAATGDPEDLTAAQVRTLLNVADGANVTTDGTQTLSNKTFVSVELAESDTNPTCEAGNYTFFADTSEATIKQCVNGTLSNIGAGGALKNTTAAVAPSANEDSAAGYSVFSRWYDTTTGIVWVATDVTPGAAVWVGDSDTNTDDQTLQEVADQGRRIRNANSLASALCNGTDLNADNDYTDTDEGGKCEYYDPAVGYVEQVYPDTNRVVGIPSGFAAIWQYAGTDAMRIDDTTMKYHGTWRPLQSIEVPGFEFGGCTYAETAITASKPKLGLLTCTDADADGFDFDFKTPANWNAGTVTVQLSAFHTGASPNNSLELDCSGQAVSDGDVIADKVATGEQPVVISFVGSAQYKEEVGTSAAITINGTPTAGDHIYMHCDVDAGNTSVTMTSVRIRPVAKVTYTKTQLTE